MFISRSGTRNECESEKRFKQRQDLDSDLAVVSLMRILTFETYAPSTQKAGS